MKIEIGESLMLSWLRHVKECQIAQTNWKASSHWELKNQEKIEQLLNNSANCFSEKFSYDLFKSNSGLSQILAQAEIDALGITSDGTHSKIYAIDVAFHEAGLNYGSKEETVTRVIKKCIRTAMCIYGYFGLTSGTIIFASPKINPSVMIAINECMSDMTDVLKSADLDFELRIIANDDFRESILEPVLSMLGEVSDTSELFMRSLQMYNLFVNTETRVNKNQRASSPGRITPEIVKIENTDIDGLKEMKIGAIVRTVFRSMLEDGAVSHEEVKKMQTREYSKETFDIQFPLLLKTETTGGIKPVRYYANPVCIYGINYFLCSEWYEVPANNDRPYLMKWLILHKKSR